MFDVTFTTADLAQLTIPQLDAVLDYCDQLEWELGIDLRETIAEVKLAKENIMELAWSDTSSRIWA
ncbi:MAG: hypothetical protein EBS38_01225 [Actinobacteria bacterium]|nr:hypothetical protein [Actinomycetota bacterium]